MRTLLLVGLVATTAWADAPISVSKMIYFEGVHLLGADHKVDTVISLRADGTYSTILRESFFWLAVFGDPVVRTVDKVESGTYTYEKISSHSAKLTFSAVGGTGVSIRNLEFNGDLSGNFYFNPAGSGAFSFAEISGAPIVNASARGTASANKPLIVGFSVAEPLSRYVLIRAVGPGLTQFGVENAAEDTRIEIFGRPNHSSGSDVTGYRNDDWEDDSLHTLVAGASPLATTVGAFMGAFPLESGSKDSAIVLQFPPGNYTAVIRTKSETPAEVLGEVYIVP